MQRSPVFWCNAVCADHFSALEHWLVTTISAVYMQLTLWLEIVTLIVAEVLAC